jgi:small subunit ribosomal protein S1
MVYFMSQKKIAQENTEKQKELDLILQKSPEIFVPKLGDMVEGVVVSVDRKRVVVDIGGLATGIITGKEMQDNRHTVSQLSPGDKVTAVLIDEENQDGVMLLSLRKASQKKAWEEFVKAYEQGTVIQVRANEANKGGLLVDIDGVKGFIPLSQLAPLHYPRVEGANSEKIFQKLTELVGKTFHVKIITLDQENKKLILSERAAMDEEKNESLANLKVGQKVKGKISGVVSYGIFVTFNGLEGLVHISEIDWGHVEDPKEYGKVGDDVEVLVIGVDESKISLSMKRLKSDPWVEIAKKYKLGDVIEGIITRVTPFGAFMKLEEGVNGLIHLSELSHGLVKDPSEFVELGKPVKAKIITLDLDEHRIGLSLKALQEKKEEMGEKKEKTEKEKKTAKKEKKEEVQEEEAEKKDDKPIKKEKKGKTEKEKKPTKKEKK